MSDEEARAKWSRYCKSQSPKPSQASQQPPQQQTQPYPRSASCSDITGTSDTSSVPTAQDCKDANTSLHAARGTREKYPLVSADEYQKAAKAARRAGDTQLELDILREAATAPPSAPAEEPCAASIREAASYLTGAEAIKKEDRTCRGLMQAAENYFTAGKIFVRAIKSGQSEEEIANSCEYKNANALFLQRDKLNDLVDKMRQNGLCDRSAGEVHRKRCGAAGGDAGGTDKDHMDEQDCAHMRERLKPYAINEDWIVRQMKQAHCNPDGTRMSLRDTLEYEINKPKFDDE